MGHILIHITPFLYKSGFCLCPSLTGCLCTHIFLVPCLCGACAHIYFHGHPVSRAAGCTPRVREVYGFARKWKERFLSYTFSLTMSKICLGFWSQLRIRMVFKGWFIMAASLFPFSELWLTAGSLSWYRSRQRSVAVDFRRRRESREPASLASTALLPKLSCSLFLPYLLRIPVVPGFELGASHVLSELSATESHAQPLGVGAFKYLFRGEFFSTSGKFSSGRKLSARHLRGTDHVFWPMV